jgi:hypothetical protein
MALAAVAAVVCPFYRIALAALAVLVCPLYRIALAAVAAVVCPLYWIALTALAAVVCPLYRMALTTSATVELHHHTVPHLYRTDPELCDKQVHPQYGRIILFVNASNSIPGAHTTSFKAVTIASFATVHQLGRGTEHSSPNSAEL